MVCFADMRNLREASCCKVDVVKGAAGRRVLGFDSTETTSTLAFGDLVASASASACFWSSKITSPVSFPLSSKF